ncbi:zinc finger BED domain-containing protein RICESLEEPER 4-like [Lactuca sativa]|uniref:zinc finger BED domain-containing protein RICESLEEPER 4-like n=1 Tax=Lactuca sativa TaxID=4236 RepID=UPI000CD8ED52|nr:zinc finger BED domain-containing protein RICESLEEPER 4-like [Lactuca sativa]
MATSENDKQAAMSDEHEDINEPEGQEPIENHTQYPKKMLKLAAWNHFDPVYVDGVRKWAKCIHCKKKLTGRATDGTTHLKDHHKIRLRKDTRDIRQRILVQGHKLLMVKPYMSNYAFDVEVSRDELEKMIIIHDYPLSIVEHYGFRKHTESLQLYLS